MFEKLDSVFEVTKESGCLKILTNNEVSMVSGGALGVADGCELDLAMYIGSTVALVASVPAFGTSVLAGVLWLGSAYTLEQCEMRVNSFSGGTLVDLYGCHMVAV